MALSMLSLGRSYLTIAIGCTGGKHRSVFVANELARQISAAGWEAASTHRDIPLPGLAG